MRGRITKPELQAFTRRLGQIADKPIRVYLTGGSCAVLRGWRKNTADIDMTMDPELDVVFEAIPKLKNELNINLEFAAPSHFVPELPGWRDRSPFITQEGNARFYEYDFYSQALSKLERGHTQDLVDVQHMVDDNLVDPPHLLGYFKQVEHELGRYPAIDANTLKSTLQQWVDGVSD